MDAVLKWPVPMKNLKEVQSFLGLLGYYRKFIPHFSHTAKPLHSFAGKDVKFVWTNDHSDAVQKLKVAITSPQCLAIFDRDLETTLTTDACDYALGAVLSQKHTAGERPVAFISRLLVDAELNYNMWEKELLAVVWAIKEFRPYLTAHHFTLLTDNKPSMHILKSTNLKLSTTASNRIIRWMLALQSYSFTPLHKDGKSNVVADALSRFPVVHNLVPDTMQSALFCQNHVITFPHINLTSDFIDAYKRNDTLHKLYVSLLANTIHPRFTLHNQIIVTRETPYRVYLPDDA